MKIKSNLLKIVSNLFIYLALFTYLQGDDYHFFPPIPKNTPTGTISGKISPVDSGILVLARQREDVYGGIAGIDSTTGKFTINKLPSGTYDLMLMCIGKPYYNVIGQQIESDYIGDKLIQKDKEAIQVLISSFSAEQDRAYLTRNLTLLSESKLLAKNFKNREQYISKIQKRMTQPDYEPLKVATKRKNWLIGRNQNKAYVICNMVKETEANYKIKTYGTSSATWDHRVTTNVQDELFYFEKQDEQWVINNIEPINLGPVDYIHGDPSMWNGYILYNISGPLVGIKVTPNNNTSIGEYTLTKIKNPSTNKIRPYKFEHKYETKEIK